MGYSVNRQCFDSTADALVEWESHYPMVGEASIVTSVTPATIDSAGLVSWSLSHFDLTTNSASTNTGTTQLPTCTVAYDNTFDAEFAGALFAFAFCTVVAFWMVARVGRTILRSMGIPL